ERLQVLAHRAYGGDRGRSVAGGAGQASHDQDEHRQARPPHLRTDQGSSTPFEETSSGKRTEADCPFTSTVTAGCRPATQGPASGSGRGTTIPIRISSPGSTARRASASSRSSPSRLGTGSVPGNR